MKIKKLLKTFMAGILSATIILSTACKNEDEIIYVTDEAGNTITGEDGEPVTMPPEGEETTVTTEDPNIAIPVKVGFVYGDKAAGSTQTALYENARMQIERSLGVETCYIESVLVADFPEAVNTLKEDDCNVIISCGNKFGSVTKKESEADESSTFYICLGSDITTNKMASFQSRLYQPANVAGIAAAYNSINNKIGIVGDTSVYSCYSIINAFILGAKEITDKSTDVRLNWVWSTSDNEVKSAIDDLVGQGCDVLFLCQTSEYGIKYCEEKGVKVIGMAYNMPELAPTQYITGIFYNYSTYLIDKVRSVQYEVFNPNCYQNGMDAGAVRLGDINPDAKSGTDEIVKTLYDIVNTGKSEVFIGEIRDNYGNIQVEKGETLSNSQILDIAWLEESVKGITDFTEPVMDPVSSDFIVHY